MAAYEYIQLSGVIVADTETTKAEVQDEFKLALGDDLDLGDETPEGVVITSETITRNGVAVNNASLANQINPNYAGGIFLDSIWALTTAITGGRVEAKSSTFSEAVPLTGEAGTFIPQGSIALTTAGDEFESVGDVTLDSGGTGSIGFQSVELGPIPCGVGDLNTLGPTAALGWETVSNTVSATLGNARESDEQSRFRRNETLGDRAIAVNAAMIAAIARLDGYISQSYRENFTSSPAVIDGVNMAANSFFVCVDGCSDSDVAAAIVQAKTPGTNWNGTTLVSYTDPNSGQAFDGVNSPQVAFYRTAAINVWVRVTIAQTTVSDAADIVEQAVLDYASGLIDGMEGFVTGNNVSSFEIAGAINIVEPLIFTRTVETSTDGISYSSAEIPVGILEKAFTEAVKIDVVIT